MSRPAAGPGVRGRRQDEGLREGEAPSEPVSDAARTAARPPGVQSRRVGLREGEAPSEPVEAVARVEARPREDSQVGIAGHELAMGLRAAYLTMHRRANAELARFGLTADQFVILTALAEDDGVTQAELVRRTGSDPNAMSERLGRLERRGLVVRERHDGDGRARRVSLTRGGRRLQERAWAASVGFRDRLAGLLPAKRLRELIDHLERIARAMTDPDDAS